MMDERTIYLGERRRVTLDAWLITGEECSVESPTYTITCGEAEVGSGALAVETINGHQLLSMFFEPTQAKPHVIAFQFGYGNDLVVRKLKIDVLR